MTPGEHPEGIRARLLRECLLLGGGGDRLVPPKDTLARWTPEELWQRWGITRLASLTRLDRIGIPVWASVRPNAKTLAICQGKGVDDHSAAASALMEAIEIATAERHDHPVRRASRSDLERDGQRSNPLASLLVRGARKPADSDELNWVPAWDLVTGERVWLPSEAVLLDDTHSSIWWRSTDGLASGNIMPEAVLHGLCERIERDAMALWGHAPPTMVRRSCFDTRALGDAELNEVVERVERAGMLLRVFDVTSDIDVPCAFAVLFPKDTPRSALGYLDVTSGSGCHPRRAKAAVRAVTEAVQSRLTKIAAARDDFDPDLYDARLPPGILLYADCDPGPPVPQRQGPPEASCFLECVLEALERAAIRDVWLVIFADEPGLAVVKAVMPGLESLPGPRAIAAGPRLVKRMMGLS